MGQGVTLCDTAHLAGRHCVYFKLSNLVPAKHTSLVWTGECRLEKQGHIALLKEGLLGMLLGTEFILFTGPFPLGQEWNMSGKHYSV